MAKADVKSQHSPHFDFQSLLIEAGDLDDLELRTELRLGSDENLDRIVKKTIYRICAGDVEDRTVKLMESISVFGREFESYKVFLSGDLPQTKNAANNYIAALARDFDIISEGLGFLWRLAGFVNKECDKRRLLKRLFGGVIYSDREDKRESAPDFLKRVYKDALSAGELTLSDLRKRDEGLWRALRNWAHAGKHDLDAVIPRGQVGGGRPPLVAEVDPSTLNPDDPRDALALQALRHRASARESARRKRIKAVIEPK